MSDPLIYRVENSIAHVTLNRPEKMNALNQELFDALIETAEEIKGNNRVRAVVLSGTGKAFCSGMDVHFFQKGLESLNLNERTHGLTNNPQHAVWVWHELPVPVIAAVHGNCFGGGLQLMSGADMRYVHPESRLSILEIKWGIVPDMAGTQLWSSYVREDIIRELCYTGRIFTGQEAADYGFATRVCEDPLAAARETAEQIVSKNPDAIRACKRLMNNQRRLDVAAGLLAESVEQSALIGTANQKEAVMANFEKREPRFEDPT